jgi:hypothetical protein
MTKFKKVIATAEAKVAKAEAEAFAARLEAIEAILQNASVLSRKFIIAAIRICHDERIAALGQAAAGGMGGGHGGTSAGGADPERSGAGGTERVGRSA